MKVTFIGNHDAPETIYPMLYEAVEGLVLRGANDFTLATTDALMHLFAVCLKI